MACQGCGRTSSATRLCCPTCIEFGRTSFFCSQDCFTKNWNAHDQLHALLRKKRAAQEASGSDEAPAASAARGGGGALVSADGAALGGSSGSSALASNSGGGLAPLPGGTSMLSGLSNRQTPSGSGGGAEGGSSTGSGGGSAQGAGVLGNLVGQAKAMFGTPGGPTGDDKPRPAAGQMRLRSPHPRQMQQQQEHPGDGPGRSRSPSRGGRSPAQQPPRTRARQFTVQLSLWALAMVTITGGALFYKEHQRYADDSQGQAVIAGIDAIDAISQAQTPPPPESPESLEADVPATTVAATAGGADAAAVASLHSEVALLRQTLDRHEQMLRYIMNRYVEKGELPKDLPGMSDIGSDSGAVPADAIPVSAVNFSVPESESRSYDDEVGEPASRGSSLRKQRGGDDGGSFGLER